MALVTITVRRKRVVPIGEAKNYDSVALVLDASKIEAVPSVCKKDGVSDGLVNSLVTVEKNIGKTYYWVTQTVTEIAALT